MTNNRVTYDDEGQLDEVSTDGGAFLEHLHDDSYFLSCIRADGSEFCLWFDAKITMTEEREPPKKWRPRMQIDPEELSVMRFMLDHLERVSFAYDQQLHEHIVEASNRLYDLTEEEPDS